LDDAYFPQFVHAVGSCGLALAHAMPVLQEFYSYGIRVGVKGKCRNQYRGVGLFRQAREAGGFRRWAPVSAATRVSFWRAFGIPPDTQERFECHFSHAQYDSRVLDCSGLPALHERTFSDIYTSFDYTSCVVPLQPFQH